MLLQSDESFEFVLHYYKLTWTCYLRVYKSIYWPGGRRSENYFVGIRFMTKKTYLVIKDLMI